MENPAKLLAVHDLFGSCITVANTLEGQGDGRIMIEQDDVKVKLVIKMNDFFRMDVLMVLEMIWNVTARTYHHNQLALVVGKSPLSAPSMRLRPSQTASCHLANSMPHIHKKAEYLYLPEF